MVEEHAELLGCPDLSFGCQALRRVDSVGDVAGDVAQAHGVLERTVEDGVDVVDRLGRHALAVAEPALGEQRLVEGVELGGGEPLQWHCTERGDDVGADVGAVVRER